MSDRPAYPRRPSHFAHRFVRVLHKSCAAQDIGQSACYLLCIVAHTEDAGRYSGPARFWNSQLMETLGFRSPKQLDIARNKAADAGWLFYDREGTRSVGEYFVAIPERFATLEDTPIEPRHDHPILSAGGTNSGKSREKNNDTFIPEFFPLATQEGEGTRNENDRESGKPPIPTPTPTPNSCRNDATPDGEGKPKQEYPAEFEEFWNAYPKRDGRRNGKSKSLKLWKQIKADDRLSLLRAAVNFSQSRLALDNKARDPERFLKEDWWRGWLDTAGQLTTEQPSIYRDLTPRQSANERAGV